MSTTISGFVDKVNKSNSMAQSDIALCIDRLMRRIHTGLQLRAERFDTHRVGPGGGMLLLTLADIEPAPVQALVRHMARDKSQMTRAIQTMERKGLIERQNSPTDARVSMLRLSPLGHDTVAALRREISEVVGEILAPIDTADAEMLKSLLEKIVTTDARGA